MNLRLYFNIDYIVTYVILSFGLNKIECIMLLIITLITFPYKT
jgi:hypothetical protein